MNRGMRVTATVVGSVLGLWFLLAGSQKFLAREVFEAMFADFGLPLWMVPVIGMLELTGAAAVLIPRTARFGATLIAAVMVGAVTCHTVTAVGSPVAAFIALVLAGFVGFVRYRQASARDGDRRGGGRKTVDRGRRR